MKISKVLNNNAVVTSKDDKEYILIGRGIAFQRKVGDYVDESKIEQSFTSENKATQTKLETLVTDIPTEYLELSEKIIAYAQKRLGKVLNEGIYLHLTDHIHFAVERYKDNLPIKNALLWETQQLYKEEYEIGIEALNMICDQFGILLPEDEAGFLALHIVNAQLNEEMPVVKQMTKVMQEILTIMKYYFKMEFDENSLQYHRFITHLKFFSQRLIKGTHYQQDNEEELLDIIKDKYPKAYECSEKIKRYIEGQYTYKLTNDELLYLTIHIEKVIKNSI